MKLLHRFPLLAFSLVLLSIVGLCIAQQSVELLLVAGALAAMSWYVTEGPRGRFLPGWVSTVLVVAVAVNFGAELLNGGEAWQRAVGRFGVWMTLIKLYERKSPRDYSQLLLLSLLLMMAGAVQSTQLMFGIVFALYATLGLYVVLLFQLYMSNELARVNRQSSGPRGFRLIPPAKPVIGRHLPAHFRLLAVGIAGGGFALSVAMFLVLPRNYDPAFIPTLEPVGGLRRTGFAASVDLHSSTRLTKSRRAVLSLMLLDEQDEPVRLDRPIRLRGAVLDSYEGEGRWRPGRRRPNPIVAEPDVMVPLDGAVASPGDGALTQVIRPSLPENAIFSMAVPTAIECAEPTQVLFYPRQKIVRRQGRATRDPYRVRSVPPLDDKLSGLVGTPVGSRWFEQRSRALKREPIANLARSLLRQAGVNETPGRFESAEWYRWNIRAASTFEAFLQSAEFVYTTDLSDVTITADGPTDPIELFLLETRRGHCEYFASGLAALCWNVGIPARLVTGYVAWEYDEVDQEYVVLESNAHAWVEVLTGRDRWTEMDPTPPAMLREQHLVDPTLADRLSWFYQRFEGSWNDAVVTYDADSQGRLVNAIDRGWSGRLAESTRRVREWMAGVNRAFYFGPAGYIWMGVVGFALVLATLALVRLMRRSRSLHRGLRLGHVKGRQMQQMLRQLGFYVDMLETLDAAGLGKPSWTPPLQYAQGLDGSRPEAAEIVRRLTTLFYASRFGGVELTTAQIREASEAVASLAATLRARQSEDPR